VHKEISTALEDIIANGATPDRKKSVEVLLMEIENDVPKAYGTYAHIYQVVLDCDYVLSDPPLDHPPTDL